MQEVLRDGVDVNIKDSYMRTALHFAASKSITLSKNLSFSWAIEYDNMFYVTIGRLDIAELLIEQKADVKAVDIYGNTPLHLSSNGPFC